MYKLAFVILALAVSALSVEISSFAILENPGGFKPDIKTESLDAHSFKESKPETEHPVYKANAGRIIIEPVSKHDAMLADQPVVSTEMNRIDDLSVLGNGYIPGAVDVSYPEFLYAPGYIYDSGISASNNLDTYGSNAYLTEPDVSPMTLLWGQLPYARTMVSVVSHTISWLFSSIFTLLLGSILTIGVCTYTNLCSIAFHGVGPIHEEMRSFITLERLDKISNAADFVKNAIDKYQKIQKVNDVTASIRNRRAFI